MGLLLHLHPVRKKEDGKVRKERQKIHTLQPDSENLIKQSLERTVEADKLFIISWPITCRSLFSDLIIITVLTCVWNPLSP